MNKIPKRYYKAVNNFLAGLGPSGQPTLAELIEEIAGPLRKGFADADPWKQTGDMEWHCKYCEIEYDREKESDDPKDFHEPNCIWLINRQDENEVQNGHNSSIDQR